MWEALLLGWLCGRAQAQDRDNHPCDPRGPSRPWEDIEEQVPSTSISYREDRTYRLLRALGTLAPARDRDPNLDCARRENLWACLGLTPLPEDLHFEAQWKRGKLEELSVVGPLQEGGPTQVISARERHVGCGHDAWEVSLEDPRAYGQWQRTRAAPHFVSDPPEADARYAQLTRDLASVRAAIRGGLRYVELTGTLTPNGPIVRMTARGKGVKTYVHSYSRLDPRFVR